MTKEDIQKERKDENGTEESDKTKREKKMFKKILE